MRQALHVLRTGLILLATAIATTAPGIPSAAAGDLSRIVIVPLTGDALGDLAQVPERFTATLADAAREMGASVEVMKTSRKEMIGLMDCASETPECLQKILGGFDVDALVLGDVRRTGGKATLIVTLTLVRKGVDPAQRSYVLVSSNTDELVNELSAIAPSFFAGEEPPSGDDTPVVDDPVIDPIVDPVVGPVDETGFSLRRAKTSSWVITGGGLALVGAGVAFLVTAAGRQGEVDAAPDATLGDIERLRDLNDSAERLELVGNALLITGGLVAVAGLSLAIIQGRSRPRDTQPSVMVTPLSARGGGLAITVQWRR